MGKGIVKLGEGQWAVKDGNLLAAKETNGRFKNTEFTVSRGTRASYVGRDGLIKESNLQDVNLVNNGDFSELGSELVTNVDFSNGTTDWEAEGFSEITVGTHQGRDNVAKININNTSTNSRIRQPFTYVNGTTYKIVVNVYLESGSFRVDTSDTYVSGDFISTTSTGSWQTLTAYFTAISSGSSYIWLRSLSEVAEFYVDNISVKEVDPNDYWVANTGWSIEDGVAVADNSSSYIKQDNVIDNNKTFKIQFDAVVTSGQFRLVATADAATYTSYVTESGSYTFYMKPTVSINGGFEFVASSFTGTIDNIVVNEVKIDTPRIDFTDNTDGHLLLEPQSTNLVPYSENFSVSAGWQIDSSVTLSLNTSIAPDGVLSADNINYVGSLGSPNGKQLQRSFTIAGGTANKDFTNSIYVKGVGKFRIKNTHGGVVDNFTSDITATNDWVRYDFPVSNSSSAGNGTQVIAILAATTDDAFNLDIWGAQLEELSYPTSYIPTNGSTVTRDAETCTGAGSSADFNSEEGVLYAEISALANDGTFRMFAISDGTEDNSINLYYRNNFDQITLRLKSGGSQEIFENFNITATNFS